jgi:carbonic anhydrase/acetyltransferase-like protein (isoleucine patch superfamily)
MSERHPSQWAARLRFDPTAFVAPGAIVAGDVTLGARSSVWFNTVIRGDSAPVTVGADSNVQDNSTVHVDEGYPAVIGARVTVGHRSIIHGCVIEDDCLIGMGSVVLSGARIGAGSLIGAAALVKEGQEIPPGSLAFGAPAQVIRQVSESHREAIRTGATHYVELSRSYLRRGFARPHPARDADGGTPSRDRGPMSFLEWEQLLGVLGASPDHAERLIAGVADECLRRAPQAGRWSALEVLCHVRDSDRDVLVPRLARFMAEPEPFFEDIDMTGWDRSREYRTQSPAAALAQWRETRHSAVATLATLGRPDWGRLAFHSVRGPYPLSEMIRSWVEHDLSHLHQISDALRDGA